jgi:hypothetical protein
VRSFRLSGQIVRRESSDETSPLLILLSAWSIVILEKLRVAQSLQDFPSHYGTRGSLLFSQVPTAGPYLEPNEYSRLPESSSSVIHLNIVTCWVVRLTVMMGSNSDDWIFLALRVTSSLNHTQLQRYRYATLFQYRCTTAHVKSHTNLLILLLATLHFPCNFSSPQLKFSNLQVSTS